MLFDRNIFAGLKSMGAEAIPRLIIVRVTVNIIVKGPSAAWFSHEMPYFVFCIRPESLDPAIVPVGAPNLGVDMSAFVNGGGKFIAAIRSALRKIMIPRKLKADLFHWHLFWHAALRF